MEAKFLLWDADYLIYRVGFAVGEEEPVEYALATVKSSIHGVLDRVPNTGHQLYLSGRDNFREKLATIQVYKGNRDPANRPFYYQEIKDYLINHQGALLIHGQEADDEVGIRQWERKDRSTCIVGQDKDLKMIPGWHYDPVKHEELYVTLGQANNFFFHQMLTGDRTDNIPGIKGIGEVRATKLLDPVRGDIIRMKEAVMAKYREQYGSDAERAYKEISNLLWIRREEDQVCPF